MKLTRIAATAAALAASATLLFIQLTPVTHAEAAPGAMAPWTYSYPTRYTESGVPEYGRVGQGSWQVAGIVNAGEPSIRVVYDQTVPGAYQTAMATMYGFQSSFSNLPQPGVTTGLREIGYTAHYDGVQIQVYSNSPVLSSAAATAFAQAGIPLIPMTAA
ncbi:MAG TPA: hypothetical protein VGJ60_21980 [Chloroflexota bacterium]|jgi:hypothetical protein